MFTIGISAAKARLSELVKRAEAGEIIRITRRGEPAAELVGTTKPRKAIELETLRRMTADMRPQPESAGDFIRRMRDSERY
jgi:prevent-host-death family protein